MKQAKPRQTISLFGLFSSDEELPVKAVTPPSRPQKSAQVAQTGVSSPPKGVPAISKWQQNRDGSISGYIKGSFSFGDGEAIVTSPIRGVAKGGSVVETSSGSR